MSENECKTHSATDMDESTDIPGPSDLPDHTVNIKQLIGQGLSLPVSVNYSKISDNEIDSAEANAAMLADIREIIFPNSSNTYKTDNTENDMEIEEMNNILKKMEEKCNASHLDLEFDVPPLKNKTPSQMKKLFSYCPAPEGAEVFKSITLRKSLRNASVNLEYEQRLQYRGHCQTARDTKNPPDYKATLPSTGECIIKIIVYRPFRCETFHRTRFPKYSHEIHVLGSNFLTQFRDTIRCHEDKCSSEEISETPHKDTALNSNSPRPGFLYIDGVIYDDTRFPDSVDYPEMLVQWGSKKKGWNMTKGNMATTKFSDLTLTIGSVQVYYHQYGCEHLFCISDIEILHSPKPLIFNDYPVITVLKYSHKDTCNYCAKFHPKFITFNHSRVPFEFSLWCDLCFHRYNYIDGKKIGDFKAYHYII